MLDVDVRRALHARLRSEHPLGSETLVVDEFDLSGTARVDVAVINGALTGYEIKSERDSLRRLPSQMNSYARVFDYVTIVVANRHFAHALSLVPEWWSLVSVHGTANAVQLVDERLGSINQHVDPVALAWLLWRDELLSELDSRDLAGGVRSKPRRVMCERMAASLPLGVLREVVRERLKARQNWRVVR